MEQFITFNGVTILLTTGQTKSEIQNWPGTEPDLILSVYHERIAVLSDIDVVFDGKTQVRGRGVEQG